MGEPALRGTTWDPLPDPPFCFPRPQLHLGGSLLALRRPSVQTPNVQPVRTGSLQPRGPIHQGNGRDRVCLHSGPHEGYPNGPGHHLPAQRLPGQGVRGGGLMASGPGAGCHPHPWLCCPGHPAAPHRVRTLPHRARLCEPPPSLQWPEAHGWLQP